MRIVDLPTFLALPPGTLFAKYRPCYFDELCIKGETLTELDFFYRAVFEVAAFSSSELIDKLEEARKTGAEVALDLGVEGRDGMMDPDQLFAVFSDQERAAIAANINPPTS